MHLYSFGNAPSVNSHMMWMMMMMMMMKSSERLLFTEQLATVVELLLKYLCKSGVTFAVYQRCGLPAYVYRGSVA